MASRSSASVSFEPEKVIQPIYTGGDISVDARGRVLATCLGEEALLTDPNTGEALCRIEGDGEILTSIIITPSASHLVTCSRSLAMRIYHLEPFANTNELTAVLQRTVKPHTTPVIVGTIDHTGTLLATGGADGVIKVWDIRGGYVSHTFRGHSGVISALKFFEVSQKSSSHRVHGNNGKIWMKGANEDTVTQDTELDQQRVSSKFRLASGGEDSKIRIWDLEKRKAIATLESHVSVVRSLDYSEEQNAVLSASRDKTAIVWDAQTWNTRRVIPVLESIESTGFLKEGLLLYTGGERGKVRIWETDTGREITEKREMQSESDGIMQIVSNVSLGFLLSVYGDQSLVFHSINTLSTFKSGALIQPLPVLKRIYGTHAEIIDMAYVARGRDILALATNSEAVRLVSVSTQTKSSDPHEEGAYFGADVGLLQGHEDIVICLDTDWSGCWLATGAKDNSAKLWRVDRDNVSYTCVATLTGHAESLGAIALPNNLPPIDSAAYSDPLSHPPQFLLTGSQDKTIKMWDISKLLGKVEKKSPRAIYTRKAHDKDINAIAIDHTSTLFASASQDRTVKIWTTESGEGQGVLRGHRRGVWSVKFAPKNTSAISGETGQISPSRGLILTGSGDKTIKIWSLADYSCLRTLEGHTNSVLKVLWVPFPSEDTSKASSNRNKEPTFVASAGGDGLVKVWDASTGECVSTLDNHTDRIWALISNPATGDLVSGGGDSVVTFWANTTEATAASTAAVSAARVEKEQELLNHIHHGNYRDAIVLALQLNHPARLLSIFTNVVKQHPQEEGSLSGIKAVDDVLASLADEQLYVLLIRLRDWNTNARTAPVAQRILWVVVKSYPASRLVGLRKKGRGLGDVLEALKVYTDRHYRRCEELMEESYLVDFIVRGMEEVGFVSDEKRNTVQDDNQADMIMV